MNKNLQRLAEPGGRLYLIFLVLFAAAALFFKMYELAVAEGVIILILMIYSFFSRRRALHRAAGSGRRRDHKADRQTCA